jgi:FkbM family methyltransferase
MAKAAHCRGGRGAWLFAHGDSKEYGANVMGIVRQLAERLSRRVVLRRRLPGEFGRATAYVSPRAGGLRYWRFDMRTIDPPLLRFADRYVMPGMKVWDVGANLGLFTFAAAYRAGPSGKVLAIEPDADNATLLFRTRRHMDRSRYADVDILVGAACAGGPRVARLAVAKRAAAANALVGFGTTQMGGTLEERAVLAIALDELRGQYGDPDVMKIDVEGAEVEVLRGAHRVLSSARPTLFVEVAGENAAAVSGILRPHGYRFFDVDMATSDPIETDLPTHNWLAIAEHP